MIRRTIKIRTSGRQDFVDMSPMLQQAVQKSGIGNGLLVVFCRHNGALIAINEAQAEIYQDTFEAFEKFVPINGHYHHHGTWGGERNGAAHVLSMLGNKSLALLIENGHILLGTFQRVILIEYDGPRTRNIELGIIEG